jgi:hypothetical protein
MSLPPYLQWPLFSRSSVAAFDRSLTNDFFLAVNTGLVAALGLGFTKLEPHPGAFLLPVAIAGVTICYFWYRLIRSYKGLNSGKFEVIHLIEQRLPLRLYDAEWNLLSRGEDRAKYWPFTHVELKVPWIFVSVYVAVVVLKLPWAWLWGALHMSQ